MNKNRYFLGVDGGGTKTHCVLYDRVKNHLTFYESGCTNYESLPGGFEALPKALDNATEPPLMLSDIKHSALAYACFGLAGVDTNVQHDAIQQILSSLGFTRFLLVNDAYLGIQTALDGAGVAAVNGTGYSVAGMNTAGNLLQIGGRGTMTGDRGGGSYYVPLVISAVYGQFFKHGPETMLAERMISLLGIDDPSAFQDALTARYLQDPTAICIEITKCLWNAASEGDPVARRILTESGEDYACSIRSAAERLGLTAPVDVVLLGSNFTRCTDTTCTDALDRALGDGFRTRVISAPPVAGALFWAMSLAGVPCSAEQRAVLSKQIADLANNE